MSLMKNYTNFCFAGKLPGVIEMPAQTYYNVTKK